MLIKAVARHPERKPNYCTGSACAEADERGGEGKNMYICDIGGAVFFFVNYHTPIKQWLYKNRQLDEEQIGLNLCCPLFLEGRW
jgi:hypothetical protein